MKIAALIARILLGLLFTIFGLNGFLHFIPMGPMPTGPAADFLGALIASHYMYFVSAVQLVCGVLILLNLYLPIAMVVLAPVIVNILLFHITMAPAGLPPGIIATVLWIIVAYRIWPAFDTLFQRRVAT